ncbi:MAG: D-aminoacylase [Acidobacteriota bacterium]|nr:D-aminoacylase [Acidobacteriota bacterium]
MRHIPLLVLLALLSASPSAEEFDLVIRNGRIVDGAGNPWFHGDVAIENDRVARVGRFPGRGTREIDAAGRLVVPGFIDMHSHSDIAVLREGQAEGKIRQGVTTEIFGESGSAAPRCPRPAPNAPAAFATASVAAADPDPLKVDWTDFKGYFKRLAKERISVNVASFVGMGDVRACVMGEDDRPPTARELDTMRAVVAKAMRDGAMGLSAGLIYEPNSFAQTDEIIELAKIAARYGGRYAVHMRSEGLQITDAIAETIRIGEVAKLPVHIMHFKVSGRSSWGTIGSAIAQIEAARGRGVDVTADQYPYVASSTGLTARLPDWALDGGTPRLLERLAEPAQRERIRTATAESMARSGNDWTMAVVAQMRHERNKRWEGKSIADIALALGKPEFDTVADLLLDESGSISMVYFGMNEDDVRLALKQPWVSIGSDGTALNADPRSPLSGGKPHPRSYGTFTRVLGRYVREQNVIGIEDAVRKMTSLAAQQMGIQDRGLLRRNMKADVVILDERTVIDRATFENPHQYGEGIDYVIVNGRVVLDQGRHTGERPGLVIVGPGTNAR